MLNHNECTVLVLEQYEDILVLNQDDYHPPSLICIRYYQDTFMVCLLTLLLEEDHSQKYSFLIVSSKLLPMLFLKYI